MIGGTIIQSVDKQLLVDALSAASEELVAAEAVIRKESEASVLPVQNVITHVFDAGGKRLRPSMVVLSAKATGLPFNLESVIKLAATMELIHLASLIHDDVIDQPEKRRGLPPVNKVLGNSVSVLAGDAIFAKSTRLLISLKDFRLLEIISKMVDDVCEGAALEAFNRGNSALTQDEYYSIVQKKTAVFIQTCSMIGAVVGNANPKIISSLAEYGYHVGMAFQIADDLLDYLGNPDITGKNIGTDYKEGNATLPFIIALNQISDSDKNTLLKGFGNGCSTDDWHKVVQMVSAGGGVEYAQNTAKNHVLSALNALTLLPDSKAKSALSVIAQYSLSRKS